MGWAIAIFGALFGLSGLAADGDIGAAITMGTAGVIFLLCGISLVVSSVTCDRQGIRMRSLYSKYVPASDVANVEVSTTDFGYGRRVRVDIRRHAGRTLRSPALMRYDTKKSHAQAEANADAIKQVLGLR
jgi:hypothetical protein